MGIEDSPMEYKAWNMQEKEKSSNRYENRAAAAAG
jgi:hypothetical protein